MTTDLRSASHHLLVIGLALTLAACGAEDDGDDGGLDAGLDGSSDASSMDASPLDGSMVDGAVDATVFLDAAPALDAAPGEDASVDDAGADAAREDSGPSDAGSDAEPSDAGFDAGPSDAGSDAGPSDAGSDAGPSDAGFDAGPSDAGFDAGPSDAGPLPWDAGPPGPAMGGRCSSTVAHLRPRGTFAFDGVGDPERLRLGASTLGTPVALVSAATGRGASVVQFDGPGLVTDPAGYTRVDFTPTEAPMPDAVDWCAGFEGHIVRGAMGTVSLGSAFASGAALRAAPMPPGAAALVSTPIVRCAASGFTIRVAAVHRYSTPGGGSLDQLVVLEYDEFGGGADAIDWTEIVTADEIHGLDLSAGLSTDLGALAVSMTRSGTTELLLNLYETAVGWVATRTTPTPLATELDLDVDECAGIYTLGYRSVGDLVLERVDPGLRRVGSLISWSPGPVGAGMGLARESQIGIAEVSGGSLRFARYDVLGDFMTSDPYPSLVAVDGPTDVAGVPGTFDDRYYVGYVRADGVPVVAAYNTN